MNRITINGRSIVVEGDGSSISIINGKVTVNGKTVEEGLSGIVNIRWEGPAASITTDSSIECGEVHGNVKAGNSVTCGAVGGNVKAGNSVACGDVRGDVEAGNNVTRRLGLDAPLWGLTWAIAQWQSAGLWLR